MASDEKKPMRSPIRWLFDSALLVLGAVIALRVAIGYVEPIMPILIIVAATVALVWIVVAVIRWRANRW